MFTTNQHNNGSRGRLINRLLQRQTALGEIEGTQQVGVHNSDPILGRALLNLELQLLPICIDHYVDIVVGL